jgi:hypothetical protein
METATMYKNRTILRGSEAYTNKQCGACGCINDRLGSTLARAQALVLHLYVQNALASQTETSMRLEIYCSDSWSE